MSKVSRRKIASIVGDKLLAGAKPAVVMQELAAYLLSEHLEKKADLYIRDIEAYLASRGVVLVDVTTASPLAENAQASISTLLGIPKDQLVLRGHVDTTVLGGVRLESPTTYLDATVAEQLRRLRTS